MKRRFFLGLAPAVLAARAVPASPLSLPSIQERIDHHAAEILGMVRETAPPEIGSISVHLYENWHEQGRIGKWFNAGGSSFAWKENGCWPSMWIADRQFHMNPENLRWS